jgi:OOP family OmpA-OmpF porin
MRTALRTTAALLAVAAFTGCTAARQHPACKWAIPVTGAALGALGGGLGVAELEGSGDPSNGEIAGGAAAGLVAGSLVGLITAHYLCLEAPPPPPPPPPPLPAPPAAGTKIAHLPGAHFAFDKATLTAEGREKVSEAAALLKQHPTLRVSVNGYTDSIGSDAYNLRLSERRAQTVADALVADGIAASRLDVRGFGKANPVADNATEAGRAENRRVEVIAQ